MAIFLSLFTIFPSDGAQQINGFNVTADAPHEVLEDVDIETVTKSDYLYSFNNDYGSIDYR